jgi:hypothetical protein
MTDAGELPSGWEEATVKELCGQPQYGYTESATHEAVGPKFLRITDIQDGGVNWNSVPFCPCDETQKYRLADGDILFARTGATTGKSYLVHNPPEAVFASYLIRIRPGTPVLPEYVWWYFQSSGYWASVFGGIDDGNRPNMNGSKLAALRVPFPKSKTEQRRLVARIEALTSRLEQARHARQAALAAAISSLLERRKPKTVQLQTLLSEQPRNGWSPPAIYSTGDGTPVLTLSAVTGFRYDGTKVKRSSAPTKEGAHYWLQRNELARASSSERPRGKGSRQQAAIRVVCRDSAVDSVPAYPSNPRTPTIPAGPGALPHRIAPYSTKSSHEALRRCWISTNESGGTASCGPTTVNVSCPRLQWIEPSKAIEPGEIVVGAVQLRLVFHGERGELGVGRQIAGGAESGEIVQEQLLESRAGLHDPDGRLRQPGTHVTEGGGNIKGGNQDSGMSHQSDETADSNPGEPDRCLTVQQLLPPFPGQQVLRSLIVIRVDEEVKVRNDHDRGTCFAMNASTSSSSTS